MHTDLGGQSLHMPYVYLLCYGLCIELQIGSGFDGLFVSFLLFLLVFGKNMLKHVVASHYNLGGGSNQGSLHVIGESQKKS